MWAKYRPLPTSLRSWDEVRGGDAAAQRLERLFVGLSDALFDNHWEFSYVDAKGILENAHLQLDVIILPGVETIPVETMEKITEFCKNGGKVIAMASLPVNSLSDFPSVAIQKLVADIPQGHIFFEQTFNRDHLENLLNGMLQRKLNISPKENVLCSHKLINGQNVYLIANDHSQSKELIVESKGRSLTVWNPQTGEVTPVNHNRINLGPFESMLITDITDN